MIKLSKEKIAEKASLVTTIILAFFVLVSIVLCVMVSQGCANSDQDKVRVSSLKGPTTVSLSKMMLDNTDKYDFNISAQVDAVVADVAANKADIALLPANVAANLYQKTNSGIKVIDINTLGVLKCVSQDENLTSIQSLKGKTVYMTGKNSIPQYTLDILLKANNMTEADINLQFKSEASEVISFITQDPNAAGIINEPQATTATEKNSNLHTTMDLSTEWKEVFSGDSDALVTGVTVVSEEFLSEHPDKVKTFLQEHKASVDYVKQRPESAAEIMSDNDVFDSSINKQAIANCNVTFISGNLMKSTLENYYNKLYSENPTLMGRKVPDGNFYYVDSSTL